MAFWSDSWCPYGDRFEDSEVLFVGDSIFRYLSGHIPDKVNGLVPGVRFLSGANVATLTEECETLISDQVKVCVLHVGTNDLKTQKESIPYILRKFSDLVTVIKHRSPDCEIVVSSVIPRDIDHHKEEHTKTHELHISKVNKSIFRFNQALSNLCQEDEYLHFVSHDKDFCTERPYGPLEVHSRCLALDGLHLSKEGIKVLAKNLLCKIETFQFLPNIITDESSVHEPKTDQNLNNEEFPPLPSRVIENDQTSPYCPDLDLLNQSCKETPWMATLKRMSKVSQKKNVSESSKMRSKKKPIKKPRHTRSHFGKSKAVSRGVKKSVTTYDDVSTNRFSILEVETLPDFEESDLESSVLDFASGRIYKTKLNKLECAAGVRISKVNALLKLYPVLTPTVTYPAADRQPSDGDQPGRQPSDVDQPARQPSEVEEPGRQPSGVEEPGRQPSDVDQPGRQPSDLEEPARQPSGQKSISLEVYKFRLFGKWKKMICMDLKISKAAMYSYIKCSYLITAPFIVYCNGRIDFDYIYSTDYINVELGLCGGGRKSEDFHPGKKCSHCVICNEKSEKYLHIGNKSDTYKEFVNLSFMNLGDDSCICKKCDRKIQHRMSSSENVVVFKKKKQNCVVENYISSANCVESVFSTKWSLLEVLSVLEVTENLPNEDEENAWLCKMHYNRMYSLLKNQDKCVNCNCSIKKKDFSFDMQSECGDHLLNVMSDVAFQLFNKQVEILKDSKFCLNCYSSLKETLFSESILSKNPSLSNYLLIKIKEQYPISELDSCPDSATIEEMSFHHCISLLADKFLSNQIYDANDLYGIYIDKLDELGLSLYGDYIYEQTVVSFSKFVQRMKDIFIVGVDVIDISGSKRRLFHWRGSSTVTSLSDYICDLKNILEGYEREIELMKKKLCSTVSDDEMLENSLLILRKYVEYDYMKSKEKMSTYDLRKLSFEEFVRKDTSIPLWNFLYRLPLGKKAFKKSKANNSSHMLKLQGSSNVHFLNTLSIYSQCLYRYSNGLCNQPLPIIFADLLDKFTKSSTSCIQIFNTFGLCVSKDTLVRFQVDLAGKHLSMAPFGEISRNSFFFVSLDNLDFLCKHASVRLNVNGRGLNCTTYMACQPKPAALCHNQIVQSPTQISTPVSKTSRPVKRSLSDINVVSERITMSSCSSLVPVPTSYTDFKCNMQEKKSYEHVTSDMFSYIVMKCAYSKDNHTTTELLPKLKVFLARKNMPQSVEKSINSYIGILDECCDNKDTVAKVLKILYNKAEVGKIMSHLVVVGDGKTYDYLQQSKLENVDELAWMLPFLGDWHVLKNYSLALLKVYGHAGLHDILSFSHKGRTENCVLKCTDFDKTFDFLLQTWEAMYVLEIEMFLKYKERSDALPTFDKEYFLQEIEHITLAHTTLRESYSAYSDSFKHLGEKIDGMYDEFHSFLADMAEKSETFLFWYRYIHNDCMAYILLYLAGRTGDWHLRMYALKKMMPLFHVVNSTFYYHLIPKHINDIFKFPSSILSHLEQGGFVVSLSGKPYSSIFLDENHETTINKDVKEVVSNVSHVSINKKMHFLPYRAKIKNRLMENLKHPKVSNKISQDSNAKAKLHNQNVQLYKTKIQCSSLFNNFEPSTELSHLFTGEIANSVIKESLLSLHDVAKERAEQYIKARLTKEIHCQDKQKKPYKYSAIKNFGQIKKKTRDEKAVEKFYKSSNDYLSRILQWCYANDIPPCDIEQFIQLPLAIATPDGLPIHKCKYDAIKFYQKHFGEAFSSSLRSKPETFIIDGMVILYKSEPLPSHQTFNDYGLHLFSKYILDRFRIHSYREIHICFDKQKEDFITPKSIERERRDKSNTGANRVYTKIDDSSVIPSNWRNFLSLRENKKLLVEFLGLFFIKKAQIFLKHPEVFVISGGYTESDNNSHIIKAIDITTDQTGTSVEVIPNFFNNHLEGDSLIWLHATQCYRGRAPIVIYSVDSDVPHIGMPLVETYPQRNFLIQLKENAGKNEFLDMTKLMDLMSKSMHLRHINHYFICYEMQVLFVVTGCDYISSFKYFSKGTFYNNYIDNVDFISFKEDYTGSLSQVDIEDWDDGLLAFYRLIGCMYFKKCASSFRVSLNLKHIPTAEEVLQYVIAANPDLVEEEVILVWLNDIRSMIRKEKGCESEEYWVPSNDSLKLHWMRSCYVLQIWKQADKNIMEFKTITDWGWSIVNDKLSIKWDSDSNLERIDKYRKLWTQGCNCKSVTKPCNTRLCGCKKSGKKCGPACQCSVKCCNKPVDPSIDALMNEEESDMLPINELVPIDNEYLTDDHSDDSSDDEIE